MARRKKRAEHLRGASKKATRGLRSGRHKARKGKGAVHMLKASRKASRKGSRKASRRTKRG